MTSSSLPCLTLPLTPAAARSLKVGDVVLLDGDAVATVGMPTQKRMVSELEAGRELPLSLRDGAFFHMGVSYEDSEGRPGAVHYINPTTSSRFNHLMPTLIRGLGLTATGGKGGLSQESVDAMAEVGCVYFSFVGGASALLSEGVEAVTDCAWRDLIMQFRLNRLRLGGFGPVIVAIDAHGNSIYERLMTSARERMPEIMRSLRPTDNETI
ncbi:fumarate hydratase C-terminal domain-containing protein [Bosea sp. LjRoot90]|uniref:fumarate hydratase C-terminal domain-containing protein n=1 Tax=Bosea sp. LjRoot90 TaxID=3342342 RepID=UPI003ECEC3EC